jgi:hypothetical protein
MMGTPRSKPIDWLRLLEDAERRYEAEKERVRELEAALLNIGGRISPKAALNAMTGMERDIYAIARAALGPDVPLDFGDPRRWEA